VSATLISLPRAFAWSDYRDSGIRAALEYERELFMSDLPGADDQQVQLVQF
jgi:hypothetical protein